jgi:hypothetical protein
MVTYLLPVLAHPLLELPGELQAEGDPLPHRKPPVVPNEGGGGAKGGHVVHHAASMPVWVVVPVGVGALLIAPHLGWRL